MFEIVVCELIDGFVCCFFGWVYWYEVGDFGVGDCCVVGLMVVD